ncbi:MAG: hypothetical protein ABR538_02945 [Candidatus Binatia bacterium]
MAFLAAMVVQVWTLAPVSASVIYCIGEDGHSGFEVVKAGARGCAACCHDSGPEADRHGEALHEPVSECTDITLSPASGVLGKGKVAADADLLPLSTLVAVAGVERLRPVHGRAGIEPPRGSPQRLRRHTVLLI